MRYATGSIGTIDVLIKKNIPVFDPRKVTRNFATSIRAESRPCGWGPAINLRKAPYATAPSPYQLNTFALPTQVHPRISL